MSGHPQVSRRRFTGAFVEAGLAGSSLLPAPIRALAQQTQEKPLSREMVASEIRRRADECSGLRYLVVDYYRIRYKLAFPLPVDRLYVPSIPVPTIADYPWSIWLLWELEERVNALGWAAEWFGHGEFARIAARDLEALSLWPTYCQLQQPDLASAHAARLMWTAYSN